MFSWVGGGAARRLLRAPTGAAALRPDQQQAVEKPPAFGVEPGPPGAPEARRSGGPALRRPGSPADGRPDNLLINRT